MERGLLAAAHRRAVGGHCGALIDYYARENSNFVITPHGGGATFEWMAKTEEFIAERLLQQGQQAAIL